MNGSMPVSAIINNTQHKEKPATGGAEAGFAKVF